MRRGDDMWDWIYEDPGDARNREMRAEIGGPWRGRLVQYLLPAALRPEQGVHPRVVAGAGAGPEST